MAKSISEYTDVGELRSLMANAIRLEREDIRREAFRRICTLGGVDQSDPLHQDFHATLVAYELLLEEKHGHKQLASYTRRKLKNKGVIQCLEDWAISKTQTEGFELLIKNNMAERTGEYLVLKYPTRFSETAVSAARARLESYNVSPPSA